MKKAISIILALVLCFSLVSCSKTQNAKYSNYYCEKMSFFAPDEWTKKEDDNSYYFYASENDFMYVKATEFDTDDFTDLDYQEYIDGIKESDSVSHYNEISDEKTMVSEKEAHHAKFTYDLDGQTIYTNLYLIFNGGLLYSISFVSAGNEQCKAFNNFEDELIKLVFISDYDLNGSTETDEVIIPTNAFVEMTNITTRMGIRTSTQQVTSLLVEDIKSQDEETKDYLVTYNFKNGYEEIINQNVSFTYSEQGIIKLFTITFSHCPEDMEKLITAIESAITTKDLSIPEKETDEVLNDIKKCNFDDSYSKKFNAREYTFISKDSGDFLYFAIGFNY